MWSVRRGSRGMADIDFIEISSTADDVADASKARKRTYNYRVRERRLVKCIGQGPIHLASLESRTVTGWS